MAEVGVAIAAKVAEYFVHPILQQLQCLFCVGKIIKNVERKKEDLILKQGRVQDRVQEAINRTERIDGEVTKWKNDVKSLITEVENLKEQLIRANNGCLLGWCPTWRRYRLYKKLAKTTQRMNNLNIKSDHFNPFSHFVIAPDIECHSSQNFQFFNSTQMAFNQLLEALQDDSSSIIGLWGMGGSGKTTLVTEVKKKAKDSKLFDQVVLTTVSQNPIIRNIQGEIADTLGLELKEESETGRAKRIALRLQNGERILIILDDVWAKLNLEDIGIPFMGNHQGSCKVVLTTRRLDVCTLMECQKRIQLDLLKEDEAWTLFQTHAHVGDAATQDLARAIAMECKGLPIAIVAVGTCLKGKGIDEMNVMLSKLRNAKPINVDKGVRDAFVCLELSYDYLAIPEAKQLLLICAMFPEDHNIVVEDLFRYGAGLGLCGVIDSFEIARSKVRTAINHLIDSSLLMRSPKFNTDGQEYVTMHDVVHDFALWKASKEDHAIMVNCTKELNELIVEEVVKDSYAISSWYDNNKLPRFPLQLDAPMLEFPFQLDAPKLEFLLLRSSRPLDIAHALSEGTKGIKALIILCTHWLVGIELQPQSIQWLSNLQTLRLQHWNLCDISFVVSLTRLEVLDLRQSKFVRLPKDIKKLNKLKLLDLSNCIIDECCYKVIGCCSQLEELYVPTHFPHSKNTNCYEYLMGPTALMKLVRYILEIGECREYLAFSHNEGTRYLRLGQLNISLLDARIKDLLQRVTRIEFYELEGGGKSFMPNIGKAVGGMNELTKLSLERSSEIECFTNESTTHEDAVIPKLDELVLRDMDNLKQLCHGPSPFSLFQKLERLSISNCPQLLHIFPGDCNLGNLKFLKISSCLMLTSLFPISATCTLLSLEQLQIEFCSELKHVFEGEGGGDAWDNSRFPKLEALSVNDCSKLESVCPVFLTQRFVQLQHLSIVNAPQMKFVFGGNAGEEQPMHDQDWTQIVLPLLEYLNLQNLPNLLRIYSERDHTRLPSIKTIEWRDCPNMEWQELNGNQLRNEEYKPLAAIERIELDNCRVESIFHYQTEVEEQIPTFQYLRQLILKNCARLKFVFSAHICQGLPELISLTISCCEELEGVFSGNEEAQKNLSIAQSCLLKLERLEISECNKLKFILSFMIGAATSMLPQLSTLTISHSSQMEEIFKCSNIEDHGIDNEREITFPNMKHMELNNLPRLVNVCQGFKLHTRKFCTVKVHDCPKLMPIKSATIDWTKEKLVREYELKYSQLNNSEAINLPLSVLNAGKLDIQIPGVEHKWRVIGDDDQEETNDSEIFTSEPKMLGGLVPTQVWSFQYLHSLEVTHIKKLKFLFSMSTIVHDSLLKLTSLILSDCEELEEIIAENEDHQIMSNVQVGLPELRELKVERCNKLKRLFSMFTATILPQLNYLLITEADQLEVIFGHNDENDPNYNETIVLSCLRKVELTNLPNFINVCQGLQIQVQLSDIKICNCPKFLDSSLEWALPQLGTIWLAQVSTEDSNVETSSNVEQQLPINEEKGMMSISRAESLCLEDSMNLISVWEGPTFIFFQNLGSLTVKGCRKLKCIFPSTVIRSLPCLYELCIEECEELEEIMSSEELYFPNESFNSLCFPQLFALEVYKCRKLKWLFPSTQLLPRLQELIIKECCQLKGLFNSEVEIHEEGFYDYIVPVLTCIKVDDCPIFSQTTLATLQSLRSGRLSRFRRAFQGR